MNLKVTAFGFLPETCELITALEILAHIHQDFKGEVSLVVNQEDYPNTTHIKIPYIGIDWFACMDCVCEDNYEVRIPIEEACAKIRELTSPKVDQPAPKARTAADAKKGDLVWFDGYRGKITGKITAVGFVRVSVKFDNVTASFELSQFGTDWGFIEEQQP